MKHGKVGFCGIFAAFAFAASLGLSVRADSANFYADENDAKLYHIKNAAGLKEFRDICNTNSVIGPTYVFNGKTILLDADIDLENADFASIRSGLNNDFTFDGQGHTIANFKVTGDQGVALFGEASRDVIQNLTVSNATVIGVHWVAAIIGYGECSKCFNCNVYDSKITAYVAKNSKGEDDDGDKVGAICGYLCNDGGSGVATNCYVEGCTIQGYRDVGGAFGMANGPASITNVTVKNTVVINDQSVNYKKYATDAEYDIGEIIGETDGTANTDGLSSENVTTRVANFVAQVGVTKYEKLDEALAAAKTKGSVCTLLKDVALSGEWTPIADFNGTFNGNGKTITGLRVEGGSNLGLFANTGTEATIKDLTITGAKITSASGSCHGVLAGQVSGSTITGVKIYNSTVTNSGTVEDIDAYTGGLYGFGYPDSCQCEVAGCTITGYDQVGGLIGYIWVGHLENCIATNNTVTAILKRAGGLVGKIQVAAGNLGSSQMWLNGNTVSGTAVAPDMAGGLCGQIMGDDPRYEMKNNDIDVTFGTTPKTNPIGNLRDGQEEEFTQVLEANITGNCWSDATLAANSFTYTNVGSGVDPQVINRDNPSVIVETGDGKGEHQATVVTKKSSTETQTTSVPQEAASIETEQVTVGGKTTTVAEQIEQTTKVEGVKLTTNETVVVEEVALSGVQAVVSEAKLQAIATTNDTQAAQAEKEEAQTFAEKIVTAQTVEVKVEVTVVPTVYVKPAEETTGTMAFTLEPKATVKIIENNATVATQVVPVENDMIDQTQPITVSLFTGFAPAQIVHRDDAGNVIDNFTGSDISYDSATGIATVEISHFSTLTAYDAEQALPVAQVVIGGETKTYTSLSNAVEAAKAAGVDTVTLLTDCTVDSEVVVGNSYANPKDVTILNIEGTNSVSGGYYTITVKDAGKLYWDNYNYKAIVSLKANIVDQTAAGNGFFLRGWDNSTPLKIFGSIQGVSSDTLYLFRGVWFMGEITATTLKLMGDCTSYGSVVADSITGGTYRGPVTADSVLNGTFWESVTANIVSSNDAWNAGTYFGSVVANSISAGTFYNVTDYDALLSKVVSGKTLVYGVQGGTPKYMVKDLSAVGATALRSGATINYEDAQKALLYSAPNDIVTMVAAYKYGNLTLSNAVALVIPTGVSYTYTVKPCDSQHVIKATAIEGGTQYVNAVDPEAAVAYLVHGTTTNYCVTVAGAINDAVSGDEIWLTKDCAEALALKVGVTVKFNGKSFTGTYTTHDYGVAVVDETAGTITERYRESTDDDAVASLDASLRTLYYAKVSAAVDAAYDQGTTVKLLKNVTLTDDDVQTSGGANFICKPIGVGKTFDGDGHTVTYTGSTVCNFITSLSGTITNATFTGLKQGIVRDMHHGAAFANVKVTGTVQYDAWNWGAFADNVYADRMNNSCSFTDCEMAVDFTAATTPNGECHNGAFVGWLDGTNTLNFTRCRVTGNMRCGMAGMFIANVAYTDAYTLNVTDCYNEGLLSSVYPANQDEDYPYYFNPIVGYSSEDRLSRITVNLKQDEAELVSYTGIDDLTNATLFAALKRNGGDFVNGNVVALVTTAGDSPVTTYYTDLSNAFANATSGATVKMLQDVDLAGKNWKPVNFCGIFDGNNKTISNLVVTNSTLSYTGFFTEFSGLAKDVTFTGADVSGYLVIDQGRAAVFAGVADSKYQTPTTISNVTITASTVRGQQKCGGLVGFIRGPGNGYYAASIDIIDCNVNNVNLLGWGGNGLVQTGGLVGNVGSGSFINIISNTVSNITIDDKAKVKGYSVPDTQFACHAFMGVLVNGRVPTESYTWGIAIFDGNTTDQCPESMVVRGRNYSEFIGDYANWDTPISGTKYLPTKLVVDGYEVTLARANVVSSNGATTNTYATLQGAFNVVQEGETIDVLANNDETITVTNTCSFTFNSNGYDLSGGSVTPAEGYAFTKNGNVCTYGVAAVPVCKIGDTEYTSLAAAVAAVPTAGATATTIQMIANETMTAETKILIGNRNIVLDLNGFDIVGSGDASKTYYFIEMGIGSTLTVDDTSDDADGSIVFNGTGGNTSVQSITLYNCGGTLTVKNGLIKNTSAGLAYAINNSSNAWADPIVSTFNLEGGTLSAPNGDAALRVYVNAGQQISANSVNISGGTILDTGIFVDTYSYLALSPNMVCDINITGGTVNGLIDLKLRNEVVTMNITGGTFGNSRLRVRNYKSESLITKLTEPAINISGGTFTFQSKETAFVATDWDDDSAKAFKLTGGTYSVEPPADYVTDGYKVNKVTIDEVDCWVVGEIVDTGDDTTAVVVTAPQTASVDTNATAAVVKDPEVAEKVVQNTVVTGVKLVASNETHAVSGAQSVVNVAKETGSEAFSNNLEKATNVIIQVDVEVKPTVYVEPVAETTKGEIKFNLQPVATVTIDEGGENRTNKVEVTNEMLDLLQDIVVTVYTGFKPLLAVHTDKSGETIETFDSDHIQYDEATGNATIIISHFSDVTFFENSNDAVVTDCADKDGSEKDVTIPQAWLLANNLTVEDATGKAATANGLPVWQSYVLGLDPNETLAAGSIVVLPQDDGSVDVMFAGWTGTVQADLATVTFKFYADTEVDGAFETAVSQTGDGYFEDMDLVESVRQAKRFFKNASITFVWKSEE